MNHLAHHDIVIVGPTASGKSNLAVFCAETLDGEVISADSRQVYRGLDIGSGKISPAEMRGIPHHLLDVADPRDVYTAADFKRDATAVRADIASRGKRAIICGGTGFYIQAITEDLGMPAVAPNWELREKLAGKSAAELHEMLARADGRRAAQIDPKNPHRLIRALEITAALGAVPEKKTDTDPNLIWIGINPGIERLKERIGARLVKRMADGMLDEVRNLHAAGVTWARLESLGLEYKYCALHLQGKIAYEKMVRELESEIVAYAKRQITWFKRNKSIRWFEDPSDAAAILAYIKKRAADMKSADAGQ